jgi:hypothetical protein
LADAADERARLRQNLSTARAIPTPRSLLFIMDKMETTMPKSSCFLWAKSGA